VLNAPIYVSLLIAGADGVLAGGVVDVFVIHQMFLLQEALGP
jgi:hypothetical protein